MALVDIDDDPWLLEFDSCEKLSEDIQKQLASRSRELDKTSHNYAKVSANIRILLKQYSVQLNNLKDKLDLESSRLFITAEETERRQRQIENLLSKEIQLRNQFEGRTNNSSLAGPSNRTRLFMNAKLDSDDEPIDMTNNLSVTDIRTQMRRMEDAQDQGLDALSKVISRQKQIAETIGGEVDYHNEILDDLADQIESTDTRISRETRQVTVVSRTDSTWGYWIIIISLLVAIILVWIL